MISLEISLHRYALFRIFVYVFFCLCILVIAPRAFSGSSKSAAVLNNVPANVTAPPVGSWEYWIKALKESGKDGLPGRPDGQSLESPLPTWVDCHLSRYIDQPLAKKNPLFSKLVLRSTTTLCSGQLEDWAP